MLPTPLHKVFGTKTGYLLSYQPNISLTSSKIADITAQGH